MSAAGTTAGGGTDTAGGAGTTGGTGAPDLTRRQLLAIIVGLMLGMFLAALDQTVVATAIRVIGDDLDDLSAQAWVTTAFLITSTLTTPLYGKLSDMYGRKPFFLFAITVFVIGSVLCSTSTSMYVLAGFRALQGIGAGGLFTLALAIVADVVSPRERARYQSYFIAVFGTSSVAGPLIGGALAGRDSILGISGWRWIFLVNVPVGIVALVVVWYVLNLPRRESVRQRIDYAGALLLVLALVPLLLVAEQGRTWGWTSAGAIACYVVGVAGLVSFLVNEQRQGEAALIPLRLFKDTTFALASAQTALVGVGMFGTITVIPLYLQIVKGATPTESGLLTLPLVGGIMVASLVSGQITSRTGSYRIFPVLGAALMVAGMLTLWRLTPDSSYLFADTGMALIGLGLGLTQQTLTLAMQNAVPPRDLGVATASSTFFRQIGGTLGVAVFLSVLYSLLPGRLTTAFTAAQGDAAYRAAAAADPAGARLLRSPAVIDDSSALNRLSAALVRPWKEGFTDSIGVVFVAGACVLAVALVLALLTRGAPLGAAGSAGAAAGRPAPTGPVDPADADAAEGPQDADGTDDGRAAAEVPPGRDADDETPAPVAHDVDTSVSESPHPACVVSTHACRERAGRSGDREPAGTAGPR